jgi:O-phospho-L-seryl-tRNASec:L-selenocysteinyl-tRNA synthase
MWNKDFLKKMASLGVPDHMLERAAVGFQEIYTPIQTLLEQRTIPDEGWSENQIEFLLAVLSNLDSDKDPCAIRIGEREARVATPLLEKLTGGFNHGIGRSGELSAAQPKAAGASVMQSLTQRICLSLIKHLGLPNIKGCLISPMGTGMSIGFALRGLCDHYQVDLRKLPKILYPRIDHMSPIKGINYVGGELIQIDGHFGKDADDNEGVFVSLQDIERIYEAHRSQICSIFSTTTFFAPRLTENVKEIAKFAKKNNLIHIVNNAYGLQCPKILESLKSAIDAGRVDAIIQSTDKNFLTPVGGAIILSPKKELTEAISKAYAGRASASSTVNLLISLLALGKIGYLEKIKDQQQCRQFLEEEMNACATEMGESVIKSNNPVSLAMSLKTLNQSQISDLGGYLYNLRLTGPRIIDLGKSSFGTCAEDVPYSYIVMNAAIGVKKEDISLAVQKLREAITQLKVTQK